MRSRGSEGSAETVRIQSADPQTFRSSVMATERGAAAVLLSGTETRQGTQRTTPKGDVLCTTPWGAPAMGATTSYTVRICGVKFTEATPVQM